MSAVLTLSLTNELEEEEGKEEKEEEKGEEEEERGREGTKRKKEGTFCLVSKQSPEGGRMGRLGKSAYEEWGEKLPAYGPIRPNDNLFFCSRKRKCICNCL